MGFHQRPTDGVGHPEWHFHAHFFRRFFALQRFGNSWLASNYSGCRSATSLRKPAQNVFALCRTLTTFSERPPWRRYTVHSRIFRTSTGELETVPRGTAGPIANRRFVPSNHAMKDDRAAPLSRCWFSQL